MGNPFDLSPADLASLSPLSAEEEAALSPRPGLFGRVGQQFANAPSDIYNDIARLAFNIGLTENYESTKVPQPYDIPEAETGGEIAIDTISEVAKSIPLFLTGSGVGMGAARIAGAGKRVTDLAKMTASFALPGLAESPEAGAGGAALGAASEAASYIPARYRLPLAGAVSAASAIGTYSTTGDRVAAGQAALLGVPFLFGKGAKSSAVQEAADRVAPLQPKGLVEVRPPEGSIVRQPPEGSISIDPFKTRDTRSVIRHSPSEPQIPTPPAGSLTRIEPPEGSLLRVLPPPGSMIERSSATRSLMEVRPPEGSIMRTAATTESGLIAPPPGSITQTGATRDLRNLIRYTAREEPPIPPPNLPKMVQWNGKWMTEEEALASLGKTFAEEATKKETARTQVTTKAEINPKRNITLKTILHEEDSEMIVKATQKLGVQYEGIGIDGLNFTDPRHGGTFSLPSGTTYKDLKNKVFAKQQEFSKTTPKTSVKGEQKLNKEIAALEPKPVEPVATLQPEKAKPVKPKSPKELKASVGKPNMVGTIPVAIEGQEYNIVKQGGKWYDASKLDRDNASAGLLANTKQEAVQVLKKQHLSTPSSLEEAAVETGGKTGKIAFAKGERVSADFGEGLEPAVVVASKDGITTVKSLSGRDVVDRYDHQIQSSSKTAPTAISRGKEENYGTLEDLQTLEQQNELKSTFKLREGRASESGAIPADVAIAIGKYVSVPLVGAAIGAALDEPDKRLRGAILGAAAAGLLITGGPVLLKRLADANPNVTKAGSVAAGVKEATEATFKAAIGAEEFAAKVATGRKSTGFERVGRWMEKHLHTSPEVIRLFGRSNEIEVLGESLHKALTTLSRNKFTPEQNIVILDYLFGKQGKGQLDRSVGKELGDMVSAAGEIRTALQKVTTIGMKDGKLKTTIEKSYDEYLTTTYKFFTDPKYFPTDEAVLKAAQQMDVNFGSVENRMDILYDWLHQVQANRKQFKIVGGFGESLGSLLARKNPNLTPAFKDMLGIYDDPIQRLAVTGTKLVHAARTAKFFDEVSQGVKQNGLKMVYSAEEKDIARVALQHQLEKLKAESKGGIDDITKVATLQSKIQDLRNYVWSGSNPTFGKLSSTFIDRRVRDSLNTFDAVFTHFQSPMAKTLLKWTNGIKYGKILLSPLQFSRQAVTFPLMGMMAKTFPSDWGKAWQTLFNNPAERERLTKIGVIWGDQVSGMLKKDLEAMMEGRLDDLIQNRMVKKGLHKWEEMFRTPDLLVRISAFQREEARLLRAGRSAREAEDGGIDFANRYSMNYAAVPPGIQKARQIPFLNQYLTFAYEAARIAKNLGEDAIMKKDPHAMAILGTLATAPFLLEKASEAMLSDKDREDWKRLKSLQQDYRRGNFNIVTSRDQKGNFHFVNFTPLIIHDTWMKMGRDIMSGDMKAFLADNPLFGWDNTPLLNVASNAMTGTDLHTKVPLKSFADQFHAARRELAPPLVGSDLDRLVDALKLNEEGGLGITDSRTGATVSLEGLLASYLTSVRSYSSNLTNVQLGEISTAKQQVQEMHSQLKKVLRSNQTQAAKDAAIERFKQRARQRFFEARQKTGLNLAADLEPEQSGM